MCTDAYRAALTQEFRLRAEPHKNDRGAPVGTTADGGLPVALSKEAAIVNGEAVDQR
jgi:hypothetical protein